MTEPDDFLERLTGVLERLERMSLEHKVVDPQREREVDAVIDETRQIVSEVHRWRRERESDERFVTFLEALGRSTAAAQERLATSEARLAHVEELLAERNTPAFKADPQILAEGEWLKKHLAGPSPSGVDVRYLKDAPRRRFESGIDVLGAELTRRVVAAAVPKPKRP